MEESWKGKSRYFPGISRAARGGHFGPGAVKIHVWALKLRLPSYYGTRRGATGYTRASSSRYPMYLVLPVAVEYLKKSEAEYAEQQREKQEKNLHRRARELGYKLEKIEKPTPVTEPATEAEAK